ncbi:hydroxyisourate hydrolase [Massilia sp. W12]|uniref:hydroxyisourate hydrolase n=1 Tax=Massilia sp. W12 TaxID=3126507 RepID=UPI0030D06402
MAKLSTHVLDTHSGRPAHGMQLQLHRLSNGQSELLLSARTNADGRLDAPLLQGESMQTGRYSLTFQAAEYFRAQGMDLPEPAFLEEVCIQFGIADASQNYHVPLVLTPWSYATYRGS